uniref:Uncharacterized protein n=1 Tax=Oryza barthii TaxID=65489 RepID=A0A0D3GCR0_9ORYZ
MHTPSRDIYSAAPLLASPPAGGAIVRTYGVRHPAGRSHEITHFPETFPAVTRASSAGEPDHHK